MKSISPSKIRVLAGQGTQLAAAVLFAASLSRAPLSEGILKAGPQDVPRSDSMLFQVFQSPATKQQEVEHAKGLESLKNVKIQKVQEAAILPIVTHSNWEAAVEGLVLLYLSYRLGKRVIQARGEMRASAASQYGLIFDEHMDAMLSGATVSNSNQEFSKALKDALKAKGLNEAEFIQALKAKLVLSETEVNELLKSLAEAAPPSSIVGTKGELIQPEASATKASTAAGKAAAERIKKDAKGIRKTLERMGLQNRLPNAIEETLDELNLKVKITPDARAAMIESAKEMKKFMRDPVFASIYGDDIWQAIKNSSAYAGKVLKNFVAPRPLDVSEYQNSIALKISKDKEFLNQMKAKELLNDSHIQRIMSGEKVGDVVTDPESLQKIAEESRPFWKKWGKTMAVSGVALTLLMYTAFKPSAQPPTVAPNRVPVDSGQVRKFAAPADSLKSQLDSQGFHLYVNNYYVKPLNDAALSPKANKSYSTDFGFDSQKVSYQLGFQPNMAGGLSIDQLRGMPFVGLSNGQFSYGQFQDTPIGDMVPIQGHRYFLSIQIDGPSNTWSFGINDLSTGMAVSRSKLPLPAAWKTDVQPHPERFGIYECRGLSQ